MESKPRESKLKQAKLGDVRIEESMAKEPTPEEPTPQEPPPEKPSTEAALGPISLQMEDIHEKRPRKFKIPTLSELPPEPKPEPIIPTTTKRPTHDPQEVPFATSHETSVVTSNERSTQHVPPVLSLVKDLPKNNPRIHILGEDYNSKFIAHAMSQIHDHVELLSWSEGGKRSRNVETVRYKEKKKQSLVKPIGARLSGLNDSKSHIDHLILGGYSKDAVRSLIQIEHRLDANSTICLMNDGLGVLEDVRERVFSGSTFRDGRKKGEPQFLLGHMTHRISYNRKLDSIREMRRGQMRLTRTPALGNSEDVLSTGQDTLATSLQGASELQSSMAEYQDWLKFKMPSIIMGAVVDPTCVMFNTTYQKLIANKDAIYIMDNLLMEILAVLDVMPELEGSNVGDMIRESPQRMSILRRLIMGRKNQPSPMLQLLKRGGYTDVNYLNGYFVQRGEKLGINMPRNNMARDLVRGWHRAAISDRNEFIPVDEKPLTFERVSRLEKHESWVAPRS